MKVRKRQVRSREKEGGESFKEAEREGRGRSSTSRASTRGQSRSRPS